MTSSALFAAKGARPFAFHLQRGVRVVAAGSHRSLPSALGLLPGLVPAGNALASDFTLQIREVGSTISAAVPSVPDITVPEDAGIFSDNPFLIVGGLALLGIPIAVAGLGTVLGGKRGAKSTTAAQALEALAADAGTVFVDLRQPAEIKEAGSPDLKSAKGKKIIGLPYKKVSNVWVH
jgi:hypothetical protein